MASLPISEVTRLPKLKIRQEMPPDAFMEPKDAAALFEKGTRQVLVLSYGWLSAAHADPSGSRLELLRRFLCNLRDSSECGLFIDQVCLPQPPRTKEEDELFFKGLHQMGSLYASVTSSTVVQIKGIPPRPSEFDGRLVVRQVPDTMSGTELAAALAAAGVVQNCLLEGTVAQVQFASHEHAEALVRAVMGRKARRFSAPGGLLAC